jgi:hypothetical protein
MRISRNAKEGEPPPVTLGRMYSTVEVHAQCSISLSIVKYSLK